MAARMQGWLVTSLAAGMVAVAVAGDATPGKEAAAEIEAVWAEQASRDAARSQEAAAKALVEGSDARAASEAGQAEREEGEKIASAVEAIRRGEGNELDGMALRAADAQARMEELTQGVDVAAIEARSREYLGEAAELMPSDLPAMKDVLRDLLANSEYADEMNELLEIAVAEGRERDRDLPKIRYRLLVSRSMDRTALRAAVEMGKRHPDLALVFRGTLENESLPEFGIFLAEMGGFKDRKEDDPVPTITIDPTAFTGEAPFVPALQRVDEQGKVIAEARGVMDPVWLQTRIDAGHTGDLGKWGETVEVVEVDLIEVMKRRMAAHDWKSQAEEAVQRFWKGVAFEDLPVAKENRTRTVDPSVVVAEDIVLANGRVLARKGDVINPADSMPFHALLIVIDGTRPEQVAFAREQVLAHDNQEVWVVTTRVDRERGWEQLGEQIEGIGRMVFLMMPGMIERFGLEAVPSTVEGDQRMLVVKEYALSQG